MIALALSLALPANACGGLACSVTAPVLQAGERIVFAVDTDAHTVEAHVQISYEGPSEDFAWIVPVPAAPEVFLSSDLLFNAIAPATQATFTPVVTTLGSCSRRQLRLGSVWGSPDYEINTSGPLPAPEVTVVSRDQVGPYDSVVLQANDADALASWLGEHNYDLPTNFATVIAPYVAEGQAFLALRLLKDRDAGDLTPIAFRYAGDKASIPIQLTSIAAAPDLPLQVFYLGAHRAVPLNYLHVQINEAAIDWLGQGANYAAVVGLAADEAGGHAFATDYAGSTSIVPPIFPNGPMDLDALRALSGDANGKVSALVYAVGTSSGALTSLIEAYVTLPAGVASADYVQCPACYILPNQTLEWDALLDAVQVDVIAPGEHAQELVSAATTLTGLTSSLSAAEMTVDPIFGENPDLPEVSNQHTADVTIDCHGSRRTYSAGTTITLADGREVLQPSSRWLAEHATTLEEELARSTDVHALVIEQLGESGPPVVIADNTNAAAEQAEAYNDSLHRRAAGFGCSATGNPSGWMGLMLISLAALTRRRR